MEDTSSCSDGTDSGQENKDHVPRSDSLGQGSPPLVTSTGPPCFDTNLASDQSNSDSLDHDHHQCPPFQQATTNRITVSELIRTLTQPNGGTYPRGVSPKDLFDFICKLPEDQRISKSRNHLQVLLWRDVKLGKIQRLGTGVYTVPEFYEEIAELKRLDLNGDPGHGQNLSHSHAHNKKNEKSSKTGNTLAAPMCDSSLLTNGHHNGNPYHESRDGSNIGAATIKQEDPGDFSPKLTIHMDDQPPPVPPTMAEGALDLSSSRISLKITMKTPNKRKRNHPLHHSSEYLAEDASDQGQKSTSTYAVELSSPSENEPPLPENGTNASYCCSNMPILVSSVTNDHCSSGADFTDSWPYSNKNSAQFPLDGQLSTVDSSSAELRRSGDSSLKKKKRIKKENEDSDSKNSSTSCTSTGFQPFISTTTTTEGAVCFFCQMTSVESIIGHPEKLLTCYNCRVNAHPTCMGYTAPLAERCRSYQWQCSECKICSYCSSADKPESLLLCDDCDRGYHMHCHEPPILEKPLGRWSCKECSAEAARKCLENGIGSISHGPKPKKPKNASSRNLLETAKRNILIQNTVESIGCTDNNNNNFHQGFFYTSGDKNSNAQANKAAHYENQLIKKAATEANNWTVDQVYAFICQLGFPEQAVAFRREEIDGQALLLLKRNDVLSMLSLKLGPALKIHRRLSILQSIVLGTGEPDPDNS